MFFALLQREPYFKSYIFPGSEFTSLPPHQQPPDVVPSSSRTTRPRQADQVQQRQNGSRDVSGWALLLLCGFSLKVGRKLFFCCSDRQSSSSSLPHQWQQGQGGSGLSYAEEGEKEWNWMCKISFFHVFCPEFLSFRPSLSLSSDCSTSTSSSPSPADGSEVSDVFVNQTTTTMLVKNGHVIVLFICFPPSTNHR